MFNPIHPIACHWTKIGCPPPAGQWLGPRVFVFWTHSFPHWSFLPPQILSPFFHSFLPKMAKSIRRFRRTGPFQSAAFLLLFLLLLSSSSIWMAKARLEILKDAEIENEQNYKQKKSAERGEGNEGIENEEKVKEIPVNKFGLVKLNISAAVKKVEMTNTKMTGSGHFVEVPSEGVHLKTAIEKVEIAMPKKRRTKREEVTEEEETEMNDDEEGEGRGLESIVDEVEEEVAKKTKEEEERPVPFPTSSASGGGNKKPRKTFSKQTAKKEAEGKTEKAEKGAAAPAVAAEDKKKAAGGADGGKKSPNAGNAGGSGTDGAAGSGAKDKEKVGGTTSSSGGQKSSAPNSSGSGGGTAGSTPSEPAKSAAPKEKPPAAAAQVPAGPPMPPPGVVPAPAPQSSQVQSASSKTSESSASGTSGQVQTAEARPGMVAASGKVPNYKLIYFDARGICEPIRLLFHYAKVPFDDVRISRKQWLALKDSTVYGKVPILEVDGKPLTYCHTIARYLAKKFDLAGRDNWEQAKVDEIADFHADVAMDLQPYMYVVAGFHQGDKHTLRQAIFLPNVEKHFPVYVNLLKLAGSGFFMPSGITWVDFVIAEYMTTVRHFEPQILDKYPAITKFVRKVQTQPQIFEYVTNREHQPV